MKISLDEAFCRYAIENQLLQEDVVAFQNQQKSIITTREALLLKSYLTLEKYQSILEKIELGELEQDSDLLPGFDRSFLAKSIQKDLITQQDIDRCDQRPFPLSQREYLLVSRIISYDTYREIMMEMLNSISDDISADTVIDQSATKEPSELTTCDKTTIIDSLISEIDVASNQGVDMDVSHAKTPVMGFPASCRDESAETIVDVGIGENEIPATVDSLPSCTESVHRSMDTMQTPPMGMNKEMFQDESAETIVDMAVDVEAPALTSPYNVSQHLDDNDESAETLVDQVLEKNEGSREEQEETLDIPYEQTVVAAKKFCPSREAPPTNVYLKEEFAASHRPDSGEALSWETGEALEPALTTPLVKTLVKEMSREVNLQTQEISRTVSKKLNSQKFFLGTMIFFTVFILIFTGVIEWQRIKELDRVKLQAQKNGDRILFERNSALTGRSDALLEKDKALLERDKALVEISRAQGEIDKSIAAQLNALKAVNDLKDEKHEMEHRLHTELENERARRAKLEEDIRRKLAKAQKNKIQAQRVIAENKKTLERMIKKQAQLAKRYSVLEDKLKKHSRFYYRMALASYCEMDYDKARSYIDLARKKRKNRKDRLGKSKAYALRALISHSVGDEENAKKYLKKAEKSKKKDEETLLAIARYWQINGYYRKALSVLAVANNPKFQSSWKLHLLRSELYQADGDEAKAASEREAALKCNPILRKKRERSSR